MTLLQRPPGHKVFQVTRHLILAVLLAVPILCFGSGNGSQNKLHEGVRPNILILMAEDMSSRVGAFGDPVATTPNIDRLAAAGVRFPNTFTTAGVCAPNRAAHITGMHQISMGGQHMRTRSFKPSPYRAVPPPQVKAYPELLRQAGYYTFTNHKLDYQFSNYGAGSGPFTIWDYEGKEPGWSQRAEGQPFYGLINFGVTHESQLFSKNIEKNVKKGTVAEVTRLQDVTVPPYYPDTAIVRKAIAQQYDNIAAMDRQVGEWLARLEADGLTDNTIVIWTTDHGDGLPRAKREIYDSGIKVPLVVHWPESLRPMGVENGSVDGRLISFVDIAPSVLGWAGVAVPDFIQGRPTLADRDDERQYVYASKDRLDEFPFRERAVRDQRYKYLYNYQSGQPGATHLAYRDQLDIMNELWAWYDNGRMDEQQAFWFKPRPQEELYDLELDPHEVNNLAEDPAYAEELQRMQTAFSDWQARVADFSEQTEIEMALQFWPNGEQPVTSAPDIRFGEGLVTLGCDTEGASIGYRVDSGGWRVYSAPFEVLPGSEIRAKSVRYGWQESEEVAARSTHAELKAVNLDDPNLNFSGMVHVDVRPDSVRFSRFNPGLLELGKPQLGFNPDKARNTTGGVITFQTDSSSVHLKFRPAAGMNRGSEFGVFIDGQFIDSFKFNAKQQDLDFNIDNPQGRKPALWEITLPSFANPELLSLEIDTQSQLETIAETGKKIYVSIGDSISHGTGQGSATHLTWPFILSRKLDYTLYNLAVGGSGVAVAQGQTLAEIGRVDLLTILIGFNDWNGEGDSAAAFKQQYDQLLKVIRASHPETPVFCISPLFTKREFSKRSGIPIDGFRVAVQQLVGEWSAKDSNIHFIAGDSISSDANLRTDRPNDPVHLGVEGAALLADSIYPLIIKEM